MPVLHQYNGSVGYYAKSHIKGRIVTFQLTETGQQRLLQARLGDGAKFPLSLLLDLYRSGDAFTGGSGVDTSAETALEQLSFDFPEDEEAEKLLPACSLTGSYEDLHLVVYEHAGEETSQILSLQARQQLASPVSLSIPLPLLDLKALNLLERMNKLPASPAISTLRHWLELNLSAYWDGWREQRAAKPLQLGLLTDGKPSLFDA